MASLEEALAELDRRARGLIRSVPRDPVDLKLRRFEPEQLVAARLELCGPERLMPSIHAGVDIRGDASMVAYRGRVRRSVIERKSGEDAIAALKRSMAGRVKGSG